MFTLTMPTCCVIAAASALKISVVCPFMGVSPLKACGDRFKNADKSVNYNRLASGRFLNVNI
ncbi:MAG: hypothetical protein HZB80_04205 [Deltaproteobacteria bacterium]|nr:hypothetical protein [Deltaproteobacteria bacterium]